MRVSSARLLLLPVTLLPLLALLSACSHIEPIEAPKSSSAIAFVTRSHASLMLGGKPFRFSGANIYWLGLQESTPISYPGHFRVDDALATASMMGATVVRSHTLGISVGCSLCVEPTLGQFNQQALHTIDYAIASARKYHIRLIIPLIDNWHYYHGGKHTFTDWRGIADENQFYYDQAVIGDFEQYISTLLNHINIYTGIAYKNDPTILAWETGNELSAPASWVQRIASYLKNVDHHHLIMDGNDDQATLFTNFAQDTTIKAVDIYTGHYYPPDISAFTKQEQQVTEQGKVFIVGEYDWNTNQGAPLSHFLATVQRSKAAGDLYWSLFSHRETHGFVQQDEHFTLHYPGDTADMRQRAALLRSHAYAMQGQWAPTAMPPGTPYIDATSGDTLSWRGSVGAATYTIERSSTGANGPWTVICGRCATDNDTPWVDALHPPVQVWYRIRAYSVWGVASGYSNVYWSGAYP